jgi:transposase
MPRTRPAYDEEFKAQAVELYLNSDQGLKQVARELGISDASLRKWRNEFLEASEGLPVAEGNGRAAASVRELADEIKRLRKENEYLRRQREILKKAAAILAEDPRAGMR